MKIPPMTLPAITTAFFVVSLSAAVMGQSSPDADAFRQVLLGHVWTWKSAMSDTLVVFEPDGKLLTREKKTSEWKALDARVVRVTFPSQQSVDLVFDSEVTRFLEKGRTLGDPSATQGMRGQKRVIGAAASSLPQGNATPASGKAPPDPSRMSLADNWIPHNVHTRKVLLDSIEFYSRAVVGDDSDAPEVIPDTIWGPVTWLMPLDAALKQLPSGARKQREFRMLNLAFPQGSLSVTMMALDGRVTFEDRCNSFKYISFICDLDRRVIGVQLVETNPKVVNWPMPGPGQVREPYYNFIEDHINSSTGNCVPYQICDAGKGVKLIKTILFNQPTILLPHRPGTCPDTVALQTFVARPYLENVHWYLTAPLAKRLLEIVKAVRAQGLDDK